MQGRGVLQRSTEPVSVTRSDLLDLLSPAPKRQRKSTGDRSMANTFQRHHFMLGAAAATGLAAGGLPASPVWAKALNHKPLDPVDPDILFGTTSSIWSGAGVGTKQTHDTPWAIKRVA